MHLLLQLLHSKLGFVQGPHLSADAEVLQQQRAEVDRDTAALHKDGDRRRMFSMQRRVAEVMGRS
jgi:hypothetical protein